MPKIKIEGKHTLTGTINISGAKNSAVALIPASILCDEVVTINNVPNISDIDALKEILNYLGYENRYSFVKKEEIPAEFHPGQTAYISVNNDYVGVIARLHPNVENNVNNAKSPVYVLEINLEKLLQKRTGKMKFKEISKFPSIKKDIAFVVDNKTTSLELETNIKKAAGSILESVKPFDIYRGENLGENRKSIAYSLTFTDTKKTLTDEHVNTLMERIMDNVCKKR